MGEHEDIEMTDADEAFCAGDTPLEEIDWERVAELERRQQEVLALPANRRPFAMVALLEEMYDGEAVIL